MENILLLVEMMVAVSPSTAQCERGFSAMNRIKTPQRNALASSTLNDLMTICVDGPSLEDFDPTAAVNAWLTSGPGTKHLGGHKLLGPPKKVGIKTR